MSVTPATSATLHSFICIARSPACPAVSADEHAVSTLLHGPCSPKVYESRPAAIDADEPVATSIDEPDARLSAAPDATSTSDRLDIDTERPPTDTLDDDLPTYFGVVPKGLTNK